MVLNKLIEVVKYAIGHTDTQMTIKHKEQVVKANFYWSIFKFAYSLLCYFCFAIVHLINILF